MSLKTLKQRLRDKHANVLEQMSRDVNLVWNYVNELSHRSIKEKGRFLSAYEIASYTQGASRYLSINSQTIQAITEEYVVRRKQSGKAKLQWRKSWGSRSSLGWIPVKGQTVDFRNGQLVYNKHFFKLWDSHGLAQYKFRQGNFSQDSRGRWYFNIAVEVKPEKNTATRAVGLNLGLKDVAVGSDGSRLKSAQFYRCMEDKLAVAQRANNKKRVRAIHAKIKNQRKDALHKFSRQIVNDNALVVVGNVSASKLAKTRMAKSVYDAGWYMLKMMLDYKCAHAGNIFIEVDEANTTQTCSNCLEKPDSRPKSIAGLGIRVWVCDLCGACHDRDENSGKLILALGHGRLAEGISLQSV